MLQLTIMKPYDDLISNKRIIAVLLLCYVLTSSLTSCYQSKLLVRQIRSQPRNVTHALSILAEIDTRKNDGDYTYYKYTQNNDKDLINVAVAALRVCGNANNHDLAI